MACHNHEHDQDHSHDHDHGHDHDDVKLFLEAYSDAYEVFAEADPLSVGNPSEILVHITKLQDFKPLEEGRVTVSLVLGNQATRQTLETPDRPGIYRFMITPELAGQARLQVIINIDGEEDILETEPLHVSSNAHAAIHMAEDMMPHIAGAVVFTKEQSWAVDFATGEVSKQRFGPVIKTVGEVLPARGNEKVLTASTSGIIRFAGNNLYEGYHLKEKAPLLYIHGEALAEGNAAIRFQEAKNNFERAEADYNRIKELAANKIVSERELLQAQNTYQNALTVYENMRQHFSESGQTIVSPWAGYLKEVFVNEGQFVAIGQPLVSVARNRDMVIRAEVQQQYANILNHIEGVHIGIEGQQMQHLDSYNGKVLSVSRNLNPATNMLAVHIQVTASDNMIPGSLIDVYLKATSPDSLLIVPNSALIEQQGNYFVFVQIHPESFEKRQVHIGQSDGIHTAVTRGLEEGERIVTTGAIMVKMAAASGDLDPHAGHIH
jgi:membrane fusion protein, heavy metal efflux system